MCCMIAGITTTDNICNSFSGSMTMDTGDVIVLHSPGYPYNHYGQNLNCRRTVTSTGLTMKVNIAGGHHTTPQCLLHVDLFISIYIYLGRLSAIATFIPYIYMYMMRDITRASGPVTDMSVNVEFGHNDIGRAQRT